MYMCIDVCVYIYIHIERDIIISPYLYDHHPLHGRDALAKLVNDY